MYGWTGAIISLDLRRGEVGVVVLHRRLGVLEQWIPTNERDVYAVCIASVSLNCMKFSLRAAYCSGAKCVQRVGAQSKYMHILQMCDRPGICYILA